jgi:MFS family permease
MQAKFEAIRQAPRELRLVYVLKLLESFADFSTSLNFVLYLTNDFGLSDLEAGTYYGVWGVVTSVYGMMLGPAIDRLGVRWSLVAGGAMLTLGRALMAMATSRSQVIVAAFMLQPCGSALAIPVLSIAIRRTTNDLNRSTAYGVFYAVMNVGALLSGLGTDAFNSYLTEHYGKSGAMRALFWTGTATSLVYTLVAYLIFRDTPPKPPTTAAEREHLDAEVAGKTTWQNMREIWADAVFWRLVVFTAFLFGARSIFRHMDTTYVEVAEVVVTGRTSH